MRNIYLLLSLLAVGCLDASAASRLFGAPPTGARSALISQTITTSDAGTNSSYTYAQIAPVTMGKTGFGHQVLVSKVTTGVPELAPMPRPTPEILSASLNQTATRTNTYSSWYGIGSLNYSYTYTYQYSGMMDYLNPVRYNSSTICSLSNQNTASFKRLCNVVRAPEPSPALWKSSATAYFKSNSANIASQLSTFLKNNGVSSGYYKYSQEIKAYQNGNIVNLSLVWNAQFDSSRGIIFGNPSVINPDPVVLWVSYIPLRLESGIDQSFALPDGGYLKYQVRDKNNVPISETISVNTSGAYDEPTTTGAGEDDQCGAVEGDMSGLNSGACVDSNAGLRCLMDKASTTGCVGGVPDVMELMDATGATYAVVDYTRRIKPKYVSISNPSKDLTDYSTEETDPNAEAPEEIAAMTVNVASRRLEKDADCNQVYINEGTYSYVLENYVERWMEDLDGNYHQLGDSSKTYTTPLTSYSLSMVVPGKTASDLSAFLISPMAQDCVAHPEYCLVPTSAIYQLNSNPAIVDNSGNSGPLMSYFVPSSQETGGLGINLYCAGLSKEDGVRQDFFGYSDGVGTPNSGQASFTLAGAVSSTKSANYGLATIPSSDIGVAYAGGKQSTFIAGNLNAQELYATKIAQVNMCEGGEMGTCDTQTGYCTPNYTSISATSQSSCMLPATEEGGIQVCDTPPDCYFDEEGNQICPPPSCTTSDPTFTCPAGFNLTEGVYGKTCAKPQNKVFYLSW